jgi:hypothetical protein
MQQVLVIKTRKNYRYYSFYDLLCHDTSTRQIVIGCNGRTTDAVHWK